MQAHLEIRNWTPKNLQNPPRPSVDGVDSWKELLLALLPMKVLHFPLEGVSPGEIESGQEPCTDASEKEMKSREQV